MKNPSYVWTVIANLIVLFVFLAIFHAANSPFEQMVFAMLMMIYITIVQFTATWGKGTMELGKQLCVEFENVLKAIGKDTTEYKETMKITDEAVQPIMVKYWINASFNAIFSIIALYNLVTAL